MPRIVVPHAVAGIMRASSGGDNGTDVRCPPDNADNCLEVANADKSDRDDDGFGNICDADLNNSCNVDSVDLGLMRACSSAPMLTPIWTETGASSSLILAS